MSWTEMLRKSAEYARKSLEELATALRPPSGAPSFEPAYSRYRNRELPNPQNRRSYSTQCQGNFRGGKRHEYYRQHRHQHQHDEESIKDLRDRFFARLREHRRDHFEHPWHRHWGQSWYGPKDETKSFDRSLRDEIAAADPHLFDRRDLWQMKKEMWAAAKSRSREEHKELWSMYDQWYNELRHHQDQDKVSHLDRHHQPGFEQGKQYSPEQMFKDLHEHFSSTWHNNSWHNNSWHSHWHNRWHGHGPWRGCGHGRWRGGHWHGRCRGRWHGRWHNNWHKFCFKNWHQFWKRYWFASWYHAHQNWHRAHPWCKVWGGRWGYGPVFGHPMCVHPSWFYTWLRITMAKTKQSLDRTNFCKVSTPEIKWTQNLPALCHVLKSLSQPSSCSKNNEPSRLDMLMYDALPLVSHEPATPPKRLSSTNISHKQQRRSFSSATEAPPPAACSPEPRSSPSFAPFSKSTEFAEALHAYKDSKPLSQMTGSQLSSPVLRSPSFSDSYSVVSADSPSVNSSVNTPSVVSLDELSITPSAAVDFDILPRLSLPSSVAELTEATVTRIRDAISAQISNLQSVLTDINRISELGELPISLEQNGTVLRVHFPNSDVDRVAVLTDDKGISSGEIVEVDSSSSARSSSVSLSSADDNFELHPSSSGSEIVEVNMPAEESLDSLWSVLNDQPPTLTEEPTSVSDETFPQSLNTVNS